MGKQSKRAKFAHKARQRREDAAITRRNRDITGFIGIARNVRFTGPDGTTTYLKGAGAMIIGTRTGRN